MHGGDVRARRGDGAADALFELDQGAVEAANLGEVLASVVFALPGDLSVGLDAGQDGGCLVGAETLRELALGQVTQRAAKSAHRTRAAGDQFMMTFRQQP